MTAIAFCIGRTIKRHFAQLEVLERLGRFDTMRLSRRLGSLLSLTAQEVLVTPVDLLILRPPSYERKAAFLFTQTNHGFG